MSLLQIKTGFPYDGMSFTSDFFVINQKNGCLLTIIECLPFFEESFKMSQCNQSCEVWSRVCGYFRPTFLWNRGKLEEFRERLKFDSKKFSEGSGSVSAAGKNDSKNQVAATPGKRGLIAK